MLINVRKKGIHDWCARCTFQYPNPTLFVTASDKVKNSPMKRRNLYSALFLNQLQRHKMKHKIKKLQIPCSQLHQQHPPTEKQEVPVRLLNSLQETAVWDFYWLSESSLLCTCVWIFATKCCYHSILEENQGNGSRWHRKRHSEMCQSW